MAHRFKNLFLVAGCCLVLTACSSSSDMPRIVQASSVMPEVRLIQGMATQIEMPDTGRVQSVTVGNPDLVTAERADGIVNLLPKASTGETNLIVRSFDEDNHSHIYQYRLILQGQ